MRTYVVRAVVAPGKCQEVQVSSQSSSGARLRFRVHHPDKPILAVYELYPSKSIPKRVLGESGKIVNVLKTTA